MAFLTANSFFQCIFKKRTFVCLLFLKLNQSQNMKKKKFGGSSKTQNTLFQGSRMVIFGTQILNLYFCFFKCKRKVSANFHQKILIFKPVEFFENVNFAVRAQKIWIWTYKIMPDLWFSAVFCPIKKIKITSTQWALGKCVDGQENSPLPGYRH